MKRKGNIVIIALILVMIVSIIGVSYAAFSYSKTGTKVNSITTGSITMSYTESDNVISIDKALPTTDETGKVRLKEGEYFDFTISSEIVGDININYEISAKDVTTADRKIDGSNIKLYLTRIREDGTEEELMTPETYNEEASANSYTGRPLGEMSLYTSSMGSSESNRYRLRMWVNEEYNPQDDGGNLEFSVQINVYGKDGLSMEDRMMKAYVSGEDFHASEYRNNITSIVTKGDTIIPEGTIESWDISEKQNGSVIAYIEDDGTGAGTYKVTIGGEGKIIANKNMMSYFSGFSNTISIDLSYLDTSLVTNMAMMFTRSTKLTELDLSSFDTSNVVDMGMMFSGNIFTAQSMSLTKITFGENFNTSKVTNMAYMFSYCSNLIELDLNSFDTSNVEGMMAMFIECSSLKKINLRNFDTSSVEDMGQMFQNCSSLTNLDLRNFDTSKVAYYNAMFDGMTNVTEILVTKDKWTIPNSAITNSGITDFTYV